MGILRENDVREFGLDMEQRVSGFPGQVLGEGVCCSDLDR